MEQLQSELRQEVREEYTTLGARRWKSKKEVMEDYLFLCEGQSKSDQEDLKEFMFSGAGQEIKEIKDIKATQAWDGTYLCFAIVCGFVPGVLVTVKTGNPDAGFIVAIISAIIVPIALIVAL
jgi:hypothetical protein